MRQYYKSTIVYSFLLFSSLYLFSKNIDINGGDNDLYFNDSAGKINIEKPKISAIKISAGLNTGAANMNQYMLNRLALGGYISHQEIINADKNIMPTSRAGMNANISLYIFFENGNRFNTISAKPLLYKIGFDQLETIGATFSKGAFRAVFRGNADFTGQQLNIAMQLQQFTARQLLVGWKWNRKNSEFLFGAGLAQLVDYRNLSVKNTYIKTDSAIKYVDLLANGYYFNSGKTKLAGVGLGINTEFIWKFKNTDKPKFKITELGVQNLGFYLGKAVDYYSKKMDSAARIEQTQLSFKTLNTNTWITQQTDTFSRALQPDSTQKRIAVLAPFQVFVNAEYKNFRFNLRYMYMPGFLPALTLSYKPFALKYFQLSPALQLGGWDSWNLNVKISSAMDKTVSSKIHWMLNVYGIEALVLPKLTHGAGISAALKYNLGT
jgi:hypothetical protein